MYSLRLVNIEADNLGLEAARIGKTMEAQMGSVQVARMSRIANRWFLGCVYRDGM
jgi:hypothetical protein